MAPTPLAPLFRFPIPKARLNRQRYWILQPTRIVELSVGWFDARGYVFGIHATENS